MSSSFRHVLRIAGTDVDGTKELWIGLTKIRGIGLNLSKSLVQTLDLDPEMRAGDLNDSQIQRIESVMKDLGGQRIPHWMLNRRKDVDTGQDHHVIGPEILLATKNDIDRMAKIRSWKGVRHGLGLKVRGQKTKTTGRKGRSVGVKKKRPEPKATA